MVVLFFVLLTIGSFGLVQGCGCQRETAWKGGQKEFGDFTRLSTAEKLVLKSLELIDVEDLDFDVFRTQIEPCANLESLKLVNVELLGEFPEGVSNKIHLPRLHEFEMSLPHPPTPSSSMFAPSMVFIRTDDDESFHRQVSYRVEVGGYIQSGVDLDRREATVGREAPFLIPNLFKDQTNYERVPPFTKLIIRDNIIPDLSEVIRELSYLQLMNSQVSSYAPISLSQRLRHLHLSAHNSTAQLDLGALSTTLQSLSLAGMDLSYTSNNSFYRLGDICFQNCSIPDNLLEEIDSVFPRARKIGITFRDEPNAGAKCTNFLKKVLFSDVFEEYATLEFIFVENCYQRFDQVMNGFLNGIGIRKGVKHFVLERKSYLWHGKPLVPMEMKKIHYDLQRWDKLESWETFSNR